MEDDKLKSMFQKAMDGKGDMDAEFEEIWNNAKEERGKIFDSFRIFKRMAAIVVVGILAFLIYMYSGDRKDIIATEAIAYQPGYQLPSSELMDMNTSTFKSTKINEWRSPTQFLVASSYKLSEIEQK